MLRLMFARGPELINQLIVAIKCHIINVIQFPFFIFLLKENTILQPQTYLHTYPCS